MDLKEKYIEAYNALDEVIQRRVQNEHYPALGYTSNLDLLCEFQTGRLNTLLAEHMKGKRLSEMKPPAKIHTIQELLETVVYYCSRGIGGEVDIENTECLKESFPFQYGIGGTAVQAALALNAVGCPSVVHLTDDSREVCTILNTPFVHTVSQEGQLIHTDKIAQTNEQEPHFIIQFKKGDKICLEGQVIEIPCSNRLILTKITVNEFVPFYKPYFRWVEDHAPKVSSNVLSSFNALLDAEVLKEHLDFVRGHIERYKKNNPKGIVFFEDAHYHDIHVKRLCLESIYSCIDIVSLNEEELSYTLNKMYQFEVDTGDIYSCVKGAKYIRENFKVRKGVIIHTKDYSMYVGDPLDFDIERGLMYGNMMATAKAAKGSYGGHRQIKEILGYELSEKGLKYYQELKNSKYAEESVLVPSKYLDRPKYTIGLGDSFVGGVQICF